jgi:hypothetical protein
VIDVRNDRHGEFFDIQADLDADVEVLVNTEGLYFQACREALGSISIGLTSEQFKDISLRRGESVFFLAAERGINADEVGRLRKERDRRYTELLTAQSPVNDGEHFWSPQGSSEKSRLVGVPRKEGGQQPPQPIQGRSPVVSFFNPVSEFFKMQHPPE